MAEGFEIAHQLPGDLNELLRATLATKELSDRINTLKVVNAYDRHHRTRFGLTVLTEFIYDAGQRLTVPGNEADITCATTADYCIANIVREVTRALGPEYGTRTRIGEMLVERSAMLYITDNYSGQEPGFAYMTASEERPTHEEPYLIVNQGNIARLNNLEVSINSVHGQ